jgi:glycosyltransferase involved in cell wall biosynthesis
MHDGAGEEAGAGGWPPARRVSCVVCAYNEADRIGAVLDAVCGHPAIAEVLVVNDGSTDGTERLLQGRAGIRVLSHAPNQGKSYALSRGLAAAEGEVILLLDADLEGLDAAQVSALIAPVLDGTADVAISLRRNSLGLYRWLGLDFVSGERVFPADLVRDAGPAMRALPPWGGEAFLNERVIERGLRLAVVDWRSVHNVRKGDKVGAWRGLADELQMVREALGLLTPWGVVRQNLALLRLKRRPTAVGKPHRRPALFGGRRLGRPGPIGAPLTLRTAKAGTSS